MTKLEEYFEKHRAKRSKLKAFWEDKIEIPFYQKIWNPVSDFYYKLKRLPKNIKRWWKVVWNYQPWDYSYTLEALQVGLEGQLKQFEYAKSERGWAHVGIEKDIRKIKICLHLIDRITEDNYCFIENKVFKNQRPRFKFERMRWTEKNDVDYLMETMKSIKQWWD